MERKYMMYEGESGNMIDLMDTKPTSEPSGVKIVVPVKSGDSSIFIRKIKEQLAYFEGVYFDVPGLSNDFKILRTEDYQCSELITDQNMHICLDNVYYPIDFNKLGIPVIAIPVGLRFGLSDGIFPVPSRESLRYTIDAKAAIIEKIKKVAEFMVEKYNTSISTEATIQDVFEFYKNKSRYVTIGNVRYDIESLLKYSSVGIATPKLKGVSLLDLGRVFSIRSELVSEYYVKYVLSGKMSERDDVLTLRDIDNISPSSIYIFADRISANKRDYMKHLLGWGARAYFIKKMKTRKLGNRHSLALGKNTYYPLLELNKYPKWKWRQVIKEWQYIQSLFIGRFTDLDKIEISKEWLDGRKKKRMASGSGRGGYVKLQGEAVGKVAVDLEKSMYNQNCKFVPETIKLQDLDKFPGITVYTNHENAKILDPLYHISSKTKNRMRLVTFSDREMKNLAQVQVHNVMTYQKFMKGENKQFKRLVTAHLIYELMKKYPDVFPKKGHLKDISKSIHQNLVDLQDYKERHFVNTYDSIYNAMLEVAVANNAFDMDIYDVYLKIKAFLEKHPFVNSILHTTSSGYSSYSTLTAEQVHSVLCDLFKYYKFRIDYQNYDLPAPKPEKSETESEPEAEPEAELQIEMQEQEIVSSVELTDEVLDELTEELTEDQQL